MGYKKPSIKWKSWRNFWIIRVAGIRARQSNRFSDDSDNFENKGGSNDVRLDKSGDNNRKNSVLQLSFHIIVLCPRSMFLEIL